MSWAVLCAGSDHSTSHEPLKVSTVWGAGAGMPPERELGSNRFRTDMPCGGIAGLPVWNIVIKLLLMAMQ